MKKRTIRFWISLLLFVVFTGGTVLPYLAKEQHERSNFYPEKKEAEKESREKESSTETAYHEYLPHFYPFQDDDLLPGTTLNYPELNIAFVRSCFLPVLTPPPDQI